VIRYRDKQAYETLKAQGRYFHWPRDFDEVNNRRFHLKRLRGPAIPSAERETL
jgi:hypothetical protein